MSLFYVLGPYIFHIPVGAAYAAAKMAKAFLPGGGLLVLQLLLLAAQVAREPLKLRGPLHEVPAF